MKKQEVVGNTYGLLTVLAEVEKYKIYRKVLVRCSCDAATEKVVFLNCLRGGSTKSCGCIQKLATKAAKTTHGLRNHKLYPTWRNMLQRCQNPSIKQYPDYGGRGITVCTRWQKIENFIEDMGPGYSKGLTVERIDNNQGYSQENCKWATKSEQSRNMRSNQNLTLNGETKCVTDWCLELGLNVNTVFNRVRKGKTAEEALKPKGMMT